MKSKVESFVIFSSIDSLFGLSSSGIIALTDTLRQTFEMALLFDIYCLLCFTWAFWFVIGDWSWYLTPTIEAGYVASFLLGRFGSSFILFPLRLEAPLLAALSIFIPSCLNSPSPHEQFNAPSRISSLFVPINIWLLTIVSSALQFLSLHLNWQCLASISTRLQNLGKLSSGSWFTVRKWKCFGVCFSVGLY